MGEIKKTWDPCCDSAPAASSGTNYQDNPGLTKGIDSVKPESPGEKASNDTSGLTYSKAQPFGKGGSGYTK